MKNIQKFKKECERFGIDAEHILDYLHANLNHGLCTESLEFIESEEKIYKGDIFKEKVIVFNFLDEKTKCAFSLIIRNHNFIALSDKETEIIVYRF